MYPEDPVTSEALRASAAERFVALATRLAIPLGATVEQTETGGVAVVKVHPANAEACGVTVAFDYLMVLRAGRIGGVWEADYSDEMVEVLEEIFHAIVAGNASEVAAPGRSRVDVTLADGEVVSETGYQGCLTALTPMPRWTSWGRRTQYAPYHPTPEPIA